MQGIGGRPRRGKPPLDQRGLTARSDADAATTSGDIPEIIPRPSIGWTGNFLMNIGVRLFARARELAGTDRLTVQLPDPADVRQLREQLAEQYPPLRPLVPQLLVAVGTEYATDDTPLDARADVACFPPVSGG